MIDLYTGTPGSGKSLHCASMIWYALRYGRPVIANFPVNYKGKKRSEFTYIPNHELTVEFLESYSRKLYSNRRPREDSILLILDESQLIFNAREWNQKGRDKWLSFFTQHRKYGYHVILIAQFDGMIDKQIRSLIEYQYVHRKVSNFGIMGKLMSLVAFGKLFISVKVWYPLNEKIGSEFFVAKKKFYSMYDTYAILDEKPELDDKKKETSAENVQGNGQD